jgi:hypothetical protein
MAISTPELARSMVSTPRPSWMSLQYSMIGWTMARMELQVAYGTLYHRIPLRLATDFSQIPFKHDGFVYGVYELQVT